MLSNQDTKYGMFALSSDIDYSTENDHVKIIVGLLFI
jgi:hypothetical protein